MASSTVAQTVASEGARLSASRCSYYDASIFDAPVELILNILGFLDLISAFNLARANKKFKGIFDVNREAILLSILKTELSPFDELLQFVVSKPDDIQIPLGPCLRRRVYYNSKLMSEGEIPQPDDEQHTLLAPVELIGDHFDRLLQLFKVIRGWEQLFPRYRFGSTSDCRELRPHESERFRAALYRWMSYAQFFHGDFPRPNRYVPQKYSTDIRCKRLRLLSDTELHELNDLWLTVVTMVQEEICPSTERVMHEMDWSISREQAERMGFGSDRTRTTRAMFGWDDSTYVDSESNVNVAIIDTFVKLSPAEILHFVINRRSMYSRTRLIREVRLAHPDILLDRQSLGHALSAVLEERQDERRRSPDILKQVDVIALESSGGILDHQTLGFPHQVDQHWDAVLRKALSGNGERALSWNVDEEPQLGLRLIMSRGRLEP